MTTERRGASSTDSGAPGTGGGFRALVDRAREVKIGQVADQTRRYQHYIYTALAILLVAIYLPGGSETIANRGTPAAGDFAGGGTGATAEEVAGVIADAQRRHAAAAPVVPAGSEGAPVFPGFGPPTDDSGSGGGGGSGGDGGGGGGESGPQDEPCPAAPAFEQVRDAQNALVDAIGAPFPVNVGDLAASATECGTDGSSATALGGMLVLGQVVPLDDDDLLATIAPAIAPACPQVAALAEAQAAAGATVLPSLADAYALCAAAGTARAAPSPPPALDPQQGPLSGTTPTSSPSSEPADDDLLDAPSGPAL